MAGFGIGTSNLGNASMSMLKHLLSPTVLTLTAALALTLFPLAGNAAVTELWRSGLTNMTLNTYTVSAAAVDTNGNTIVAGVFLANSLRSLFVASFDAFGMKQWEFTGRPSFRVFVDGVGIMPNGDTVIAFRQDYEFGTSSSIISVRAGVLLWERFEPNAFGNNPDETIAKIRVNADGELFVFSFDPTEQPPGHQQYAFLSKIDPYGDEVWRTRLPFIDIGTYRMPMPLTLSASGQPIVAGLAQDGLPSVAASLTAVDGKVRWKRNPRGVVVNIVAVSAGTKSICVAGENGFVVYANNGRRIASRRDIRFGSDRIATTHDDGFILLSPYYGSSATVLSSRGRVRWQGPTGVNRTIGIFSDADKKLLAVGPLQQNGDLLAFVRLDEQGQQVLTETIEGYDGVSWNELGTAALAAPDGTLRVVANRESYIGLGFTIAAYRVEP